MGVFIYDGRHMKYWKRIEDVYIYEDPVLKSEVEKDYLIRIEENKRSKQEYDKTRSILENCISFQI